MNLAMGDDLRKQLEELKDENKKLKKELLYAYRDPLTKLWNRTFFEKFKDKIEISKSAVGVIYIDANKLKFINDNFGHKVGDQYLADTGMLILDCLKRKSDFAFRLGGDEFLILLALTGKVPQKGLKTVLNRLNGKLKETNIQRTNNEKIEISIAIGSTIRKNDTSLTESILKAEDLMYEHKEVQGSKDPMLGR